MIQCNKNVVKLEFGEARGSASFQSDLFTPATRYAGVEPEYMEFGDFDGCQMLFVTSERTSLIYIFEVSDPYSPQLLQVLPVVAQPRRGKAIPSRKLFTSISEGDDSFSGDSRAGLTISQ